MSADFYESAAAAIEPMGGFLRCEECQHQEPIGDVAGRLKNGWPKCCGYTMRWVTGRESFHLGGGGEVQHPHFGRGSGGGFPNQ
jgi:hypothetical protein